MATYHIPEEDAFRNLAALLERARLGEEIVIEKPSAEPVVLRRAKLPRRSISESIAMAEAHARELGFTPVMDADFAADLEERIRNRRPSDRSAWD